MLRLVLCGMSCGFPSVVWICAFWINEREMGEMGDERKVKWQFLEERERMEKDLYTLFKVLGLFFTFLKQNQESISVDSFFIWLKKHFFSPQDFSENCA